MSLMLTPVSWIERLFHSRKIAKTIVEKPPIFILGHWRSGTTYLTNILAQDKSKGYFKASQSYTHAVFISLGKLLQKIYPAVLPNKRPMDNMKMGANEPAEEVFALGNLTRYSIIHMMSFPKNARFFAKSAFYDELNDRQKKRVRTSYDKIVKKMTYYTRGKQLILKSPDNTCRINLLLELYPDAKFIHIYRSPYKVFPSTIGMYKTMFPIFSFEKIDEATSNQAEEVVLDIYEKLYEEFLKSKKNIPQDNLLEIKYEDFIDDAKTYIEQIYTTLKIEGFENTKQNLFEYIDSQKSYKTNTYDISKRNIRQINRRMKFFFDKYGYEMLES
ncbi:MAG: sulfotransferase [Clostridia bacterium]|nr:sulfotransferase [Clostridia bacterium]